MVHQNTFQYRPRVGKQPEVYDAIYQLREVLHKVWRRG
jgi:hypothetical protein